MDAHYINLSNGIEALRELVIPASAEVRFMRLRSTDCEHKHWAEILDGLPDQFFMDACAGLHIFVHDRACSNRANGLSRAQWQGMDWVRFAMNRSGFGSVSTTERTPLHGLRPSTSVDGWWREVYARLPERTLARLRWYSKWVTRDHVLIDCLGGIAKHDGDTWWQRKVFELYSGNPELRNALRIDERIERET